jgi:hypothetical protein
MRRRVFNVAISLGVAAGGLIGVAISPAAAAKPPAWSIVSFPNAGSSSVDFEGVDCPTAKSCFAVGFRQVGKTTRTLVERWNGTKWSVMTSPNPAGAANSYLQAVSCPSATSCFAVGYSTQGNTVTTLAEQWNGSTWTVMTSPSTTGWANPSLESVSCASTTSCVAVGHGRAITGESLVERWDGVAWSITPIAKGVGWTETSFYGVSCPSTTSCWAVGFYQEVAFAALRTLIEHWDGTSWSIVPSPSPTGALPAGLARVSCASLTNCIAVGSYSPPIGGGFKTLIERWNGSAWSTVTSPNAQSTRSILSDVSCASATNCVAVGHYFNGSTGKTLSERWTGTKWSVVATPNPAGSTDSWLKGVSCPTPTTCFAVGTARIKNVTKGLIERFA